MRVEPNLRLSRAAAVRTLLATLPVSPLATLPARSAPNVGGTTTVDSRSATTGVFQSDDKSFRLALPSASWQLDDTTPPRAEMPRRRSACERGPSPDSASSARVAEADPNPWGCPGPC